MAPYLRCPLRVHWHIGLPQEGATVAVCSPFGDVVQVRPQSLVSFSIVFRLFLSVESTSVEIKLPRYGKYRTSGNVELNWPKLLQAFSFKFTLICFHECVLERDKVTVRSPDV